MSRTDWRSIIQLHLRFGKLKASELICISHHLLNEYLCFPTASHAAQGLAPPSDGRLRGAVRLIHAAVEFQGLVCESIDGPSLCFQTGDDIAREIAPSSPHSKQSEES